jgi:hypothetical protein
MDGLDWMDGWIDIKNVVLYGYKTCDVKGRTWLNIFENRVLRRTFGPKRNELIGGCRRLHNCFVIYTLHLM